MITLGNITIEDLVAGRHNLVLGGLITIGQLGAETLAMVVAGECCNEDDCSVDAVLLRIPLAAMRVELIAFGEIHHRKGHDMPDTMVTRIASHFPMGVPETRELLAIAEGIWMDHMPHILATFAKRRARRRAAVSN